MKLCALAACLLLAGCEEPMSDIGDGGDGGVAETGRVAVHVQSTHLPPLVAGASLTLGAFEAHSDREPEAAARITLTAPLGLMSDTNTEIMQAPPATYGAVHLVAIDSLTLTGTTGGTITIDFLDVPPIALRCAGPGRYLPLGGVIDLHVALDFTALQSALTSAGLYPALPTQTITDGTLLGNLLTALRSGLTIDCDP